MAFSIYDASAPVFMRAFTNMQAWLDKARAEGKDEAQLLDARLAPDMRPLSFQFQTASDTAKGAVARLTQGTAPSMADTETTFDQLKERLIATTRYIGSIEASAFEGAAERPIELSFPNGPSFRFNGGDFLTAFVLPNFFFHVTTAYAILRANGVQVGKPDFLSAHMVPHAVAPAA